MAARDGLSILGLIAAMLLTGILKLSFEFGLPGELGQHLHPLLVLFVLLFIRQDLIGWLLGEQFHCKSLVLKRQISCASSVGSQ